MPRTSIPTPVPWLQYARIDFFCISDRTIWCRNIPIVYFKDASAMVFTPKKSKNQWINMWMCTMGGRPFFITGQNKKRHNGWCCCMSPCSPWIHHHLSCFMDHFGNRRSVAVARLRHHVWPWPMRRHQQSAFHLAAQVLHSDLQIGWRKCNS